MIGSARVSSATIAASTDATSANDNSVALLQLAHKAPSVRGHANAADHAITSTAASANVIQACVRTSSIASNSAGQRRSTPAKSNADSATTRPPACAAATMPDDGTRNGDSPAPYTRQRSTIAVGIAIIRMSAMATGLKFATSERTN